MTLSVVFYPYLFTRTILSMPFCPIPICPYTILSIPFFPYHFVRYQFVLEPKTLLFKKSCPDSFSSPYLPTRLNSKHHPPQPSACLPSCLPACLPSCLPACLPA